LDTNGTRTSSKNERKMGRMNENWEKINKEMRDVHLPEFGQPEDFIDLHGILRKHTELY
jgi:hypothetical protein